MTSLGGVSAARPTRAAARLQTRLVRAGLLPGHRTYTPFVIVSQARSGSNLLVSLLGSHPSIAARGELLKRLGGAGIETRLAEIYGPEPRRIQAAGFKCFYYHPLDDRGTDVWAGLLAVPRLHVIHLTRRNGLRTVTSRRLADLTGSWLEAGGAPGPAGPSSTPAGKPTVRFTPGELTEAFEQCDRWETECRRRFDGHPLHEVAYEDLARDPEVAQEVMRFLGVAPRAPRTRLHRQNPEPLSQLIEGFDDLQARFADTPWSDYFTDR